MAMIDIFREICERRLTDKEKELVYFVVESMMDKQNRDEMLVEEATYLHAENRRLETIIDCFMPVTLSKDVSEQRATRIKQAVNEGYTHLAEFMEISNNLDVVEAYMNIYHKKKKKRPIRLWQINKTIEYIRKKIKK